jgi:hypothetical protein
MAAPEAAVVEIQPQVERRFPVKATTVVTVSTASPGVQVEAAVRARLVPMELMRNQATGEMASWVP